MAHEQRQHYSEQMILGSYERETLRHIGAFIAARSSWLELEHDLIGETCTLYDPTPENQATTDTLVRYPSLTDSQQIAAAIIRAKTWKSTGLQNEVAAEVLDKADALEQHKLSADTTMTFDKVVLSLLDLGRPAVAHEKLERYRSTLEPKIYRKLLQSIGTSYCIHAQTKDDLAPVPAIVAELKAEDPEPTIIEVKRGWGIFSWTTKQRIIDVRVERLHKQVKNGLSYAYDRLDDPEKYTHAQAHKTRPSHYFLDVYNTRGLEAALCAAGVDRKHNSNTLEAAYAILAREFAAVGDLNECKRMTGLSIQAAHNDNHGAIPPWKLHSTTAPLMELYARNGAFNEAHALAAAIPHQEKVSLFNIDNRTQALMAITDEFLRGHVQRSAAAGEPVPREIVERVVEYVHQMIDTNKHAQEFERIIDVLSENGCVEAIRRVAKELPPQKYQKHPGHIHNAMLKAHLYNRNYEAALELVAHYPSVFRSASILGAIVRHKQSLTDGA